jgi:hypothetical protein
MDEITPPTDFSRLPKEVNEETLLKLPYSEVIKSCKLSKYYNSICNNPYFWKAKLERDFPDEVLPNLEGPQYRAQYEYFIAELLTEDLKKTIEDELDYKYGDEVKQLQQIAINNYEKELAHKPYTVLYDEKLAKYLSITDEELANQYLEKLDRFDRGIRTLQENIENLTTRINYVLPNKIEKKYIKIYGNSDELNSLISKDFLPPSLGRKYLRKYGYKEEFKPGMLFGIMDTSYSDTTPMALIYIKGLYFVTMRNSNPDYIYREILFSHLPYNSIEKFLKDYPEVDFNID